MKWRLAALKMGLKDATVYRLEFLAEFLGSACVPAIVQWILWYAMFKVGHAEKISGKTYVELVHYTLVSVLFSQVRGGNHDFAIQELIRSGQLSQYLLRPVGAVEFVYIQGVAGKLLIAIMCLFFGAAFYNWLGVDPLRMFGAMALAVVGNIIHYQIGAALATAAFYWEEAYSVLMVKNLVVSFLSGELIPLYLFPESMQWVWKSTPFYLYVFGPVQYALGEWTQQEYFYHMGMGCIWLLVGAALIKFSWWLGMRKYLSIGG